MYRRLAATVALGMAVAVLPARAQTQISLGQALVGQLTATDMIYSDGARYDLYIFYGQAGQFIQIDMQSTDFDAYLILQDQNGIELDRNDDGGGNLNARIQRTLAYTGSYRIIAKSLSSNRFGTYTISVTGSGGPAPAVGGAVSQDGVRGWITSGESRSGVLTASDPQLQRGAVYHAYLYNGRPGETITLEVMSSSLDPYAVVQDASGNALASDDDGGGNLQARLVYTFRSAGTYRLVATTYSSGTYGPYTLRVTSNMAGMPAPVQTVTGGIPNPVGTIGINQQVSGTLTSMDQRFDGKPVHLYNFSCIAGLSFQMDVLSSWDNYAIVLDPSGTVVARDDDTGEGLNARLLYTCPMSATYRLGVTTFLPSTQPGPYTLQVTSAGAMAPQPTVGQPQPIVGQAQPLAGQPAPAAQPVAQPQAMPTAAVAAPGVTATIQVGQTVPGRLEQGDRTMSDGTWADVFQFQGAAGQRVTIELRSEEFDTFLQLLDSQGNRLAEDDDSLGDLDSRIVFTLPAAGTYQIVVNNYGEARRAGTYTLTLR